MRSKILFISFFFLAFKMSGQTVDSSVILLKTDSLVSKKTIGSRLRAVPQFFTSGYPSPRKALIFSLVLPGSGQAYNRKYWKIPLALGVVGGVSYSIAFNAKYYKIYQRNYLAVVDGDDNTMKDPAYADPRYDRTLLKQARDFYQKNLEISYLVGVVGYLLVATDAFVDAHLKTFDVSDDLSLRFKPKTIPSPIGGLPTFGASMSFTFR